MTYRAKPSRPCALPFGEMRNLVGDVPSVVDQEAADELRTRAFHLMSTHPMAATHLVIAAAGIAPTCDDELDVAVQLAEMLSGFTSILQGLHRGAASRNN